MTILLGTLQGTAVRLFTPWAGAWTADVDVTLDATRLLPSGRTTLVIGTTPLLGTVDPEASGKFGDTGRVRLVGGAAGWSKDVAAQHFHNDAGVLSTAVLTATAAAVGETVIEAAPSRLGVDYARAAGPAARVLPAQGWYVTPAGVTVVGPRVTVPMDPTSVQVLGWDPLAQRAELASDDLVAPGTVLVDTKFGTATVRDVEQTFDDTGSSVTAWCSSSSSSRLAAALARFAREAAQVTHARPYIYRVVRQNIDERLVLQIVKRAQGVPDMLPISMWPGVPGASAKPRPGALVMVDFAGGDPSSPVVRGFDDTMPLELSFEAATSIAFAAESIAFAGPVAFGVGGKPVAIAEALIAWASNVTAAINALAGPGTVLPLSPSVASNVVKAL